MQWETHHTYSDRIAGKLYPEHYGDMIYHGLQSLLYEEDERETQTDRHTPTPVWPQLEPSGPIFTPCLFTLPSVLLLFQYTWDTNEEYLFKAMVAFSMRRVPNREATE